MGEEGGGHEGDIAQAGSAEMGEHGPVGSPQGGRLALPVGLFRLGHQAEFLEVILHVEVVLVVGRLADDAVEEVAGGRHVAAGGGRGIARGMHQHIAVGLDLVAEVFRHQHGLPPRGAELLPVLVGEAEDRLAREDAGDVDAHGILEVILHQTQHLVRLRHLDRALFQAVVVAQFFHHGAVDAGDERASEINRYPVGLAMGQGIHYALSGGHGQAPFTRFLELVVGNPDGAVSKSSIALHLAARAWATCVSLMTAQNLASCGCTWEWTGVPHVCTVFAPER